MRIRILSDLHYRDASSYLQQASGLNSLLDGIDALWLNGDTFDTESNTPAAHIQELRTHLESHVPQVRYLTGNHDPMLTDEAEATLANGRIWVTHGDIFTRDIVPWGRLRPVFRQRIGEILAAHPDWDYASATDRLRVHRLACQGVARESNPHDFSRSGRIRRLATELWPPSQPWYVLKTWRTFADDVARLTAAWRPEASIVITGHIHFPRVWRRGALTVINTGGFTGPMGAAAVDVEPDRAIVHRLTIAEGKAQLGQVMAEIPLALP